MAEWAAGNGHPEPEPGSADAGAGGACACAAWQDASAATHAAEGRPPAAVDRSGRRLVRRGNDLVGDLARDIANDTRRLVRRDGALEDMAPGGPAVPAGPDAAHPA